MPYIYILLSSIIFDEPLGIFHTMLFIKLFKRLIMNNYLLQPDMWGSLEL